MDVLRRTDIYAAVVATAMTLIFPDSVVASVVATDEKEDERGASGRETEIGELTSQMERMQKESDTKRIAHRTIVGASIGMGNRSSQPSRMPGESKANSMSAGLYASHLHDSNWFVNGGVSYTRHNVKTDRRVSARGVSARLSGKTNGRSFGAFGEIGKRFAVAGMSVDPSAGVRVASTRLDAFDETHRTGRGTDGLTVGAQSQTSVRSVLGVRLWREVAEIGGTKLAPSLRLAYEHEFGNVQSRLTNRIHGAPHAFKVRGPTLGREILTADLGLEMQFRKPLNVRVGGNVSARKGESAYGGGVAAKYRF